MLSDPAPVGLAWGVILGFIGITTHPRILVNPLPAADACGHVAAWLAQPQVILVHPGERHATILFDLLRALGTAGNLTTDAHLAALAIEHQVELQSTTRTSGASRGSPGGIRWIERRTTYAGSIQPTRLALRSDLRQIPVEPLTTGQSRTQLRRPLRDPLAPPDFHEVHDGRGARPTPPSSRSPQAPIVEPAARAL